MPFPFLLLFLRWNLTVKQDCPAYRIACARWPWNNHPEHPQSSWGCPNPWLIGQLFQSLSIIKSQQLPRHPLILAFLLALPPFLPCLFPNGSPAAECRRFISKLLGDLTHFAVFCISLFRYFDVWFFEAAVSSCLLCQLIYELVQICHTSKENFNLSLPVSVADFMGEYLELFALALHEDKPLNRVESAVDRKQAPFKSAAYMGCLWGNQVYSRRLLT